MFFLLKNILISFYKNPESHAITVSAQSPKLYHLNLIWYSSSNIGPLGSSIRELRSKFSVYHISSTQQSWERQRIIATHTLQKGRRQESHGSHWAMAILQSSQVHISSFLIRVQLYCLEKILQSSCLCSLGSVVLLSESSFLFHKKWLVFAVEWFFSIHFLPIVVQGSKDLLFCMVSVPLSPRRYDFLKNCVFNELIYNSFY